MGQVYLAQDEQLGRRVAVKVLPAGKINDPDAVTRFGREARALAQLRRTLESSRPLTAARRTGGISW